MIKLKDLLKESKRLNLFEQAEELNLGPIGLAAIYGDNRVTVANNNWQNNAQQLVDQINDAVADDFTLNNLQITVTGIASTATASTAYLTTGPGNSTNVPNHNYQTVGTSTGGNLPQAWSAGSGTGVRVQNGNQFLATTRARLMGGLLDQFLRSNLSKDAVAQLPQNYIVTTGVVQGNQPAMTAQITSKLTKREIREYPFKIKYRWFSLEGVSKNPLVLISGASDSTYKGANPNYGSKWFSSQFLTTIKNSAIPFAGFQKSNSDPKDFAIRGSAFIQITPDEVSGNTAYYNSYEKWLEDIQLMMKVTPDKSGTGGIEIRGTNDMLLRGPVMGSITKDRTSGVANFVKGDKSYIKLVGRKYYLLKPATESPKLMADLYRDQAQQRIPSHLRELEYYSEVTIS